MKWEKPENSNTIGIKGLCHRFSSEKPLVLFFCISLASPFFAQAQKPLLNRLRGFIENLTEQNKVDSTKLKFGFLSSTEKFSDQPLEQIHGIFNSPPKLVEFIGTDPVSEEKLEFTLFFLNHLSKKAREIDLTSFSPGDFRAVLLSAFPKNGKVTNMVFQNIEDYSFELNGIYNSSYFTLSSTHPMRIRILLDLFSEISRWTGQGTVPISKKTIIKIHSEETPELVARLNESVLDFLINFISKDSTIEITENPLARVYLEAGKESKRVLESFSVLLNNVENLKKYVRELFSNPKNFQLYMGQDGYFIFAIENPFLDRMDHLFTVVSSVLDETDFKRLEWKNFPGSRFFGGRGDMNIPWW